MKDANDIAKDGEKLDPLAGEDVGHDEPPEYQHKPKVLDVVRDAPVVQAAYVPPNFSLTGRATWMHKLDKHGKFDCWLRAAHGPVVISAALEDVDDNSIVLRISFRRRWKWRHVLVDRGVIKSTRKIVELASQDLPVDQATAPALVKYLSAYEAENEDIIPRVRCSRVMGWREGGEFLLGGSDLPDDPRRWPAGTLMFRGESPGEDQLAAAIRSKGTIEGWCEAIASIESFPSVRLALYASLAAPMLHIVGATSFVVDWSYETSVGKSTCLRVASSVWGPPEGANRYRLSWDNTRVGIERAATALTDLPLVLDDTKLARNKAHIAPTIYAITDEQGRTRGSIQGIAKTGTWRTVMLSTGEQPITSFSQDGGTRARVIALWGIPLKSKSSEHGAIAKALKYDTLDHHGHLGPEWIAYLKSKRELWHAWRQSFRDIERRFHEAAGDHAIAIRLSEAFAVLDLTAQLAHKVLPLPFAYETTADVIRQMLVGDYEGVDEMDMALEALRGALDWAQSNAHRFFGRGDKHRPPSQGWAGRWDDGKRAIAWVPSVLASILDNAGFDRKSTLRIWRDRGWVECSKSRLTKSVVLEVGNPSSTTHCNCLNEHAFLCAYPVDTPTGYQPVIESEPSQGNVITNLFK